MHTNIYSVWLIKLQTEKLSFMGEFCRCKLWFFWTPFGCSTTSGFSCQKNKLSRFFFWLIEQGFSKSMTFQMDFTPIRFQFHRNNQNTAMGHNTPPHPPSPSKKTNQVWRHCERKGNRDILTYSPLLIAAGTWQWMRHPALFARASE